MGDFRRIVFLGSILLFSKSIKVDKVGIWLAWNLENLEEILYLIFKEFQNFSNVRYFLHRTKQLVLYRHFYEFTPDVFLNNAKTDNFR